eukprot:CAMPEP_0197022662 /NCGR_PEP_ID=MMETSP1384-20130603/3479_1 /TAXON_ID=29189 /ORGANISM="Ammonia sp." /LENGTH=263 /DNA_ID=CAMNT_0042450741 /DNA_START=26 /DNA_END=814 /DNA_ORIENTATION=-
MAQAIEQDIDIDAFLTDHGYLQLRVHCKTLKGSVLQGIKVAHDGTLQRVAIKQTAKTVPAATANTTGNIARHQAKALQVAHHAESEAHILKYLTLQHEPVGNYLVRYIDFLQSDTHYYLVTEFVDATCDLRTFITRAHHYIARGLLSVKSYRSVVKFLFWQLAVSIAWLHDSMRCAHLNLCMENIMVSNVHFLVDAQGKVSIDDTIAIKICGFSVVERFSIENADFRSQKAMCSLQYEAICAPEIRSLATATAGYDARHIDIW